MQGTIVFERWSRRLSIAADKVTTLSEHYRSTLQNALVVAAERFEGHADDLRLTAADYESRVAGEEGGLTDDDGAPLVNPAAYRSLADQFAKQAEDTRSILATLAGADDAASDTAVLFVADAAS